MDSHIVPPLVVGKQCALRLVSQGPVKQHAVETQQKNFDSAICVITSFMVKAANLVLPKVGAVKVCICPNPNDFFVGMLSFDVFY